MSAFAQRQRPSAAPWSVSDVLRSPGKPLDTPTRARFESRFQHDFSRVRVHDDEHAARSAESFDARAWTFGSDIAFGRGMYAPSTAHGMALLDHELQHVVEQRPQIQLSAWSTFLDVVLFVPRLFGLEAFPFEDLKKYVDGMKERKGPQKSLFSDNMARACVSREKEFDTPFDKDTKVWLTEDMLHGWTTILDENSIITLLRRSPERMDIVAAIGRDRLWDNFSYGNRRVIEALTLTDADFNATLMERLRSLPPDDLQDYVKNAVDPKVQKQLQRIVQLQGITTPIPVTATVEPSGSATFQAGGTDIRIDPDEYSNDENLRGHAVTGIKFVDVHLEHTVDTTTNTVHSFKVEPPRTTVFLKTVYGPGGKPSNPSGYGRGTTPEDKFAGTTTMRFHEGQHGSDLIEYVSTHPVPQFNGQTGISEKDFLDRWSEYTAARKKYLDEAKLFTAKRTDCAGPERIKPETLKKFDMPVTLCEEVK